MDNVEKRSNAQNSHNVNSIDKKNVYNYYLMYNNLNVAVNYDFNYSNPIKLNVISLNVKRIQNRNQDGSIVIIIINIPKSK